MLTLLRNVIAVLLLCVVVYLVTNYYGTAQEMAGVKGMSTEKAKEVSQDIQNDLGKQAESVAENTNNLTVGEIVGFFTRFQKIPEDISNAQEYLQGQVENFTNREK
jgi:ferritin-like protein